MIDTKKITDEIRDISNWVIVFETEYDLPSEVVDKLRDRLEALTDLLRDEDAVF